MVKPLLAGFRRRRVMWCRRVTKVAPRATLRQVKSSILFNTSGIPALGVARIQNDPLQAFSFHDPSTTPVPHGGIAIAASLRHRTPVDCGTGCTWFTAPHARRAIERACPRRPLNTIILHGQLERCWPAVIRQSTSSPNPSTPDVHACFAVPPYTICPVPHTFRLTIVENLRQPKSLQHDIAPTLFSRSTKIHRRTWQLPLKRIA